MDKEILEKRTKSCSIEIGKLVMSLPYSMLNKNYSNQIVRCSGSVGANYPAACRANSKADFINKLKTVFLELIGEFKPDKKEINTALWKEANDLLSIIVASLITLRKSLLQS